MSGYHSGKFGVLNGISHLIDWSFTEAMSPPANVVSSSAMGRQRSSGVKSWDGNFSQLLAQPTHLPGDSVSFTGYTAPDNDTAGGTGVTYAGTITISQAQITWDWAGGADIMSSLSFAGHGAVTKSTGTESDSGIIDSLPVCGTKVQWSTDGLAYNDIPNLAQAQLTLTCDIIDVVNSSSGCWTNRLAGNYDWTVSLTVQDTDRTSLTTPLALGDVGYLKMFVDATNFWLLNFGIVRDFANLNVNVNTGEVISQNINIDMTASDGTDIGQVLAPDGTTRWWGVAP